MNMKPAPKSAIKLFSDVTVRGNRVGVLRPVRSESNIEIPDNADAESMKDFPARIAKLGDGEYVNGLEVGDIAIISLYMKQPHQVIVREDGDDEYHLFILDENMVVATVDTQRSSLESMMTKGKA